jgi:hypothetical protein
MILCEAKQEHELRGLNVGLMNQNMRSSVKLNAKTKHGACFKNKKTNEPNAQETWPKNKNQRRASQTRENFRGHGKQKTRNPVISNGMPLIND